MNSENETVGDQVIREAKEAGIEFTAVAKCEYCGHVSYEGDDYRIAEAAGDFHYENCLNKP